jgi:lipid-A-disaccharide synthase
MGREVVKELIQNDLNTKNLKRELSKILEGPDRKSQLEAYEILEQKLGGQGASIKTATLITENA